MNDRYQEAFAACRADVTAAAVARLGRELSHEEHVGIERIGSLMMLEAVYRSFASDSYPLETVESDLRYFASQPG